MELSCGDGTRQAVVGDRPRHEPRVRVVGKISNAVALGLDQRYLLDAGDRHFERNGRRMQDRTVASRESVRWEPQPTIPTLGLGCARPSTLLSSVSSKFVEDFSEVITSPAFGNFVIDNMINMNSFGVNFEPSRRNVVIRSKVCCV